jgi:hypothetical protein
MISQQTDKYKQLSALAQICSDGFYVYLKYAGNAFILIGSISLILMKPEPSRQP